MNDIRFRTVAETLKMWRSISEERALGEMVLYLLGLTPSDVESMTTLELENEIANRVLAVEEVVNAPELKKVGRPKAKL